MNTGGEWRPPESQTNMLPPNASLTGGFDILGMVLRRKWLILCGAVVGVLLGYLYACRATPVYQSMAQILVHKKSPQLPVAGMDGNAHYGYDDYLSTHMLMIRTPVICGRASQDHDLKKLRSFNGADPTGTIIGGLGVSRPESRNGSTPNVLNLSYTGTDPDDCARILDAVIDAYRKFLGETYENVSEETFRLFTEAKDELHKQLTNKEKAYVDFRSQSPLLFNGSERFNIHTGRLSDIEKARAALQINNSGIKARIEALEEANRRGGNREALLLMVGRKSEADRRTSTALEDQLFPLMVEEELLLEKYGPEHPEVVAVRRKLEFRTKFLREHGVLTDTKTKVNPADFISIYIESLREEQRAMNNQLRELNAMFASEQEAAKRLSASEATDESMRNDIARTQRLFDAILKRLEEINLVRNYGGFKTEVLMKPGRGWQTEPDFRRLTMVGGFFGLLVGLGIGYLVERADKSFRNPDEIRLELGLPVFGHIPVIVPDPKVSEGSPLHPMLITVHRPKSRVSEAYRAVRTSLYFSTRGSGHQVIQVTSPNPSDGKSTLVSNLAISIAHSGKKIILLDADFRRPKIHRVFGADIDIGLSTVVSGKAKLHEAIRASGVENLDLLPCGPKPENPSELLTHESFLELVMELRKRYDYVLIDTPPLLAVTDPCAVVKCVDGVLLALRITRRVRKDAMRAMEILGSLGAKVLGVVVNGVGRSVGADYARSVQYRLSGEYYNYGGYRYGYDGYAVGYGDNAYRRYYQDDPNSPKPKRLANPKEAGNGSDESPNGHGAHNGNGNGHHANGNGANGKGNGHAPLQSEQSAPEYATPGSAATSLESEIPKDDPTKPKVKPKTPDDEESADSPAAKEPRDETPRD